MSTRLLCAAMALFGALSVATVGNPREAIEIVGVFLLIGILQMGVVVVGVVLHRRWVRKRGVR